MNSKFYYTYILTYTQNHFPRTYKPTFGLSIRFTFTHVIWNSVYKKANFNAFFMQSLAKLHNEVVVRQSGKKKCNKINHEHIKNQEKKFQMKKAFPLHSECYNGGLTVRRSVCLSEKENDNISPHKV